MATEYTRFSTPRPDVVGHFTLTADNIANVAAHTPWARLSDGKIVVEPDGSPATMYDVGAEFIEYFRDGQPTGGYFPADGAGDRENFDKRQDWPSGDARFAADASTS